MRGSSPRPDTQADRPAASSMTGTQRCTAVPPRRASGPQETTEREARQALHGHRGLESLATFLTQLGGGRPDNNTSPLPLWERASCRDLAAKLASRMAGRVRGDSFLT